MALPGVGPDVWYVQKAYPFITKPPALRTPRPPGGPYFWNGVDQFGSNFNGATLYPALAQANAALAQAQLIWPADSGFMSVISLPQPPGPR